MTIPLQNQPAKTKTMSGIEMFYHHGQLGEARRKSRELDFGVWWRDHNLSPHRVTWVELTGEVYSVNLYEETVEVIGSVKTEAEIEERLKGWAEECGKEGSLYWVKRRLA